VASDFGELTMIVYRVHADAEFQTLYSANRDPWYVGAQYLDFMCKPQGEK
jgi:hypothetical protein